MEKDLLKFITCGSVDDGKSTLIGHMLYDAKLIFADQRRAMELDSGKGSADGRLDYSLLLDGLMAEREQGITIDVAYRYFTTRRRNFIVADTPGHEEYTRNMAVGASFASLCVILVDASQGVLMQTKRHARICALMGIRHFVFAVNKMDLVNYNQKKFEKIRKDVRVLMAEADGVQVQLIPVSATEGDNITEKSVRMPWYGGPALLPYLETVETGEPCGGRGFSMAVQRVCRPNRLFRGFQGQPASGSLAVGDILTVLPGGQKAAVAEILNGDKSVERCEKGQAVTIRLATETDVSRGCVLGKDTTLKTGSMLAAYLLWMDDKNLVAGRNFRMKLGTQTVPATVMKIRHRVDVNTGAEVSAETIYKNEIAFCEISMGSRVVFDTFAESREHGSLILMDRLSNMTCACGVVEQEIVRENNLTWHEMDITRELRESQMGQKAFTVWMTGLSGAGKSTIANEVEKRLFAMGKHTMILDGDNVRMGLNKNLGFGEEDRIENIRRIAQVAKLMNDAGLIVLAASISPYRPDRRMAREIIGENFTEVYVSTPLAECERRDTKGLYKAARAGEIAEFTGISGVYEVPESPDIVIDTTGRSVEECAGLLLAGIEKYL